MGKSKKRKLAPPEPEELKSASHSFVIKQGHIGKSAQALMLDVRKVLEPFTAINLKVRKKNCIKDFVAVASIFNVTHLVVFTRKGNSLYVRFGRIPNGPTLVFKVSSFCLRKDVLSSLKKQIMLPKIYQNPPILIMNGFGDDDRKSQLMKSLLRNLFPSINLDKIQYSKMKRAALLHFDKERNVLEMRNYCVTMKPVGISKAIKKLVCHKKLPNLQKLGSIEEYFKHDLAVSESEGEGLDEVESERHVKLIERAKRGNLANEKSAIRLSEIGPRLTLKLVKVQDGLMSGKLLE